MKRRACETEDPELFFPLSDKPAFQEQIREALQICLSCSFREKCLEWALTKPEVYGIWGGTTEQERRALRSRRGLIVLREPDKMCATCKEYQPVGKFPFKAGRQETRCEDCLTERTKEKNYRTKLIQRPA